MDILTHTGPLKGLPASWFNRDAGFQRHLPAIIAIAGAVTAEPRPDYHAGLISGRVAALDGTSRTSPLRGVKPSHQLNKHRCFAPQTLCQMN